MASAVVVIIEGRRKGRDFGKLRVSFAVHFMENTLLVSNTLIPIAVLPRYDAYPKRAIAKTGKMVANTKWF
jgi:hypothetical protein